MITEISDNDIIQLLTHQIDNFFMINEAEKEDIKRVYAKVKEKLEYCLQKSDNKYFSRKIEGKTVAYFTPYHSVQYCMFLYLYSRTVYLETKNNILADKIFYLNKALNSCDLFYAIELPKFWGCEHPIASLMGRAKYGEGFFFYQCCTVGGNKRLEYPTIGNNVRMFSHAQIIGNSHIGDNVLVGAGCTIKDQDVPSNSLAFGSSPNLIIKPRKDL